MLKTSTGATTNSLSNVITSYSSDNFKITTNAVSGAQSFTTNGVTYYVTNTNGGAIAATNNSGLNNVAESLFVGNTRPYSPYFGALYISGTRTVNADFIGNTMSSFAGALFNGGSNARITGNFVGNSSNRQGGAIYNTQGASIASLVGDFIGNKGTQGGAIYTQARITSIIGDFIGNISTSSGGAIFSTTLASFSTLNSNFIANTTTGSGGAILNATTISTLNGDFISNVATGSGGAIINSETGSTITNLTGDFLSNKANIGGAIWNKGSIVNLNSSFADNTASTSGGAIYNIKTITSIAGGFYANSAGTGYGGAIFNTATGNIDSIIADFMSNTAGNNGGAINNVGNIGNISGSFMNNTSEGLGGAIYTNSDLTFKADGKSYSFSDNKDSTGYNPIHIANTENTNLDFNMSNNGEFIINDSITSTGSLSLNLKGDSIGFGASTFYLNDKINTDGSLNINATDTNLYLGSYTHIDGTTTSALDMTKGTIKLNNADLILNMKGYNDGDDVLKGLTIDNRAQDSELYLYNVANGKYNFGNSNVTTYLWNDDLVFSANSLQTVQITDTQLIIERVTQSEHFSGPLKDIIIEALDDNDFCSSTASAGMDFICGATNIFVGDVKQQQAVIEGAAQMASIPGVNANTIIANRATRNAISLRQVENKEEVAQVVIYNADGRVAYTEEEKEAITQEKSLKNYFFNPTNITAAWFAPMANNERVNGLEAGKFNANYNSNFYGINAGIDKTFNHTNRLGFAIGLGSGHTQALGDFEGIENDFSFYTLGIYESFNVHNFTLNANLSYTIKQNNLSHDLSKFLMDSLYTNVGSYTYLLDMNGEYNFNTKILDIKPQFGVELIHVTTKDYKVKVDKSETNTSVGDVVFEVSPSSQELAMLNLGVKLGREFEKELSNSKLKLIPELTLGSTIILGDLYESSITGMPGLKSTASFNLEIFERFTHTAGLGFDILHDNFEFGLLYNVQFSKHRIGHAGNIECSYNF